MLTEELEAGAELPFDLEDESSRRGPPLYRYSPLTEEFIDAALGCGCAGCPPTTRPPWRWARAPRG